MSLLLYSRKHKTRVWLLSDTVDVASGLVIPLLGVRFFRSLSQKKHGSVLSIPSVVVFPAAWY